MKFDHPRRSAQASPRLQEGQQAGQPVPSNWLQGGHYHFVDVNQSKCCPPWDGLWEGCWDDRRSRPRSVVPVPHTEEDSDTGYCCIGHTERLLDIHFIQWIGTGILSQILCDVQVVLCVRSHQRPTPQQTWSAARDLATGSECNHAAPLHCAPHALARASVNLCLCVCLCKSVHTMPLNAPIFLFPKCV